MGWYGFTYHKPCGIKLGSLCDKWTSSFILAILHFDAA